jgi:AraC family transcriptional regulator
MVVKIMETTIHIKNMVCARCVKVVRESLTNLGLEIKDVVLGKAVIHSSEENLPLKKINQVLNENGFELIEDKNVKLIETIKVLIIKKIHHSNESLEKFNFTKYISETLNVNYNQLSTLFSTAEGTTIEKFIIHQKIEKVKELLAYDELTLSEIAYKLGYSSVQHLSNQFKQVTGFSPSDFKKINLPKRISLDKVK